MPDRRWRLTLVDRLSPDQRAFAVDGEAIVDSIMASSSVVIAECRRRGWVGDEVRALEVASAELP